MFSKMGTQVHRDGLGGNRMSFLNSLDTVDERRFTQWPNFSVEGHHQCQSDNHSIKSSSAASTFEILSPSQHAAKRNTSFLHRITLMFTRFPIRDMSWMVGFIFSIGSAAFVVNGFFLVLPLIAPETTFVGEASYATPTSGLVGAIIFVLGGWSGFLEGLNLKRGHSVAVTEGVSVENLEMSESGRRKVLDVESARAPKNDHDQKHQSPMQQLSIPKQQTPDTTSPSTALAMVGSPSFIWYPTMRQFRSTYHRDTAFLAGLIQFIGTIIFLIATITSVPGVIDFTNIPVFYTANLFPATFGGVLFITSSAMQMIGAQEKWYIPRPMRLDWHIGFINVIGSVGFMLAGALPYIGTTEATLQSALASFWGSWAFMIGGILQWYHITGSYC
jgi:hypothetical protein